MAINSISGANLDWLKSINSSTSSTSTASSGASFASVFQDAITQASQAQAVTEQDTMAVATGTADDLHSIMINSEKADLALQLVVQMRNKALDAYSEIMRLTL